jgi:hypothetical protein
MEGSQLAAERREPRTPIAKEMTMNAYLSALYRDATCAAAALVITLIIGASFVQSTSVARGSQASPGAAMTRYGQA